MLMKWLGFCINDAVESHDKTISILKIKLEESFAGLKAKQDVIV